MISSTRAVSGSASSTFFRACSAAGRAITRAVKSFNASCYNVLFINEGIFVSGSLFATLSRNSRMILSADFFPIPFMLSNCFRLPCKIALAISPGFIEDNIIRAVAAPIPETLINCINISFSVPSKKP